MTLYIGCNKCHRYPADLPCKWCDHSPASHREKDCGADNKENHICLCTKSIMAARGFVLESDKTPHGKWIFRGNSTYYCPHLTYVAKSFKTPWYGEAAKAMNARRES